MQPDLENRLKMYESLLLDWQRRINLISPLTADDAWRRHILDSLQLVPLIPEGVKTLCDIGSGAGFPALVIAMARPDLAVHMIESDARKGIFLRHVSRETFAENATIHTGRIEETLPALAPDCVTARALASLRRLLDYTAPLWRTKPGLTMIFPKGKTFADEIAEAQKAYRFDIDTRQSETDPAARILVVRNVRD